MPVGCAVVGNGDTVLSCLWVLYFMLYFMPFLVFVRQSHSQTQSVSVCSETRPDSVLCKAVGIPIFERREK